MQLEREERYKKKGKDGPDDFKDILNKTNDDSRSNDQSIYLKYNLTLNKLTLKEFLNYISKIIFR
jgi:hypothetical protein